MAAEEHTALQLSPSPAAARPGGGDTPADAAGGGAPTSPGTSTLDVDKVGVDKVGVQIGCEPETIPQDDRARKEAQFISSTAHPRVRGYEVTRKLGEGTYGVVWHARAQSTGVQVAIKFFKHGTGEQWQTLQAEVKQLAMLHADQNIVQLIDVEPDAVPPYFIMSYAERGSLAGRLQEGPVPVEEAVEIFRRMVEAMAYVHAKGIRHCDLKPGNILLDALGRPRVADFGQAHLSLDASPALGTFFYMAPEQADLSRQIPDTRWDVYGLGAVLYAMVTGGPPREDSTLSDKLKATEKLEHRLERYRAAVLSAGPASKHRQVAGMDSSLAGLIDRCLEVDPDKRFHDANAILEALKRREWQRRQRPLLIFGLAAPLLLLVILGALGFFQANSALAKFRVGHEAQVKTDCKMAARLIQSVIKNKLLEQADRVKSTAGNENLRAAMLKQDYLRREALLTRAMPAAGEESGAKTLKHLRGKLAYLSRTFESWALVDAQGTMIAGEVFVPPQLPEESNADFVLRRDKARRAQEQFFGKDFSWREWFNGVGDYKERDFTEEDRPPIRTPCGWLQPGAPAVHMTDSSYRTKRKSYAIGLSAPVYLEDGRVDKVAGVLLANISIRTFWEWLDQAEVAHGHALVLDGDGYCVFPRDRFQIDNKIVFPPGFDQLLKENEPGVWNDDEHELVIDEKIQLWGYAPIIDQEQKHGRQLFHWLAVVGQDRATVMEPMEDIRSHMRRWGVIILATACLLLMAMWSWLFKKLHHIEKASHA